LALGFFSPLLLSSLSQELLLSSSYLSFMGRYTNSSHPLPHPLEVSWRRAHIDLDISKAIAVQSGTNLSATSREPRFLLRLGIYASKKSRSVKSST
jgi:hypothetical protein